MGRLRDRDALKPSGSLTGNGTPVRYGAKFKKMYTHILFIYCKCVSGRIIFEFVSDYLFVFDFFSMIVV